MKNRIVSGFIRTAAVVMTALMCLCSCDQIGDSASQIASAVISSAKGEISGAISEGMSEFSEGMNEFSEGMNELSDGLGSAASGIGSAGDIVSEHIENIRDNIGSEISSGLESAAEDIKSAGSAVSEKIENAAGNIADSISSELSEAADNIAPATSASSDDTTTTPEPEKKQYTFRNKARYDDHYEKHGAEFGDITQEEYLALANELINSDSDRVLHKYSDDGDYMYFDQDTGYFLVLSEDGYIRTFFIPTAGINYWNRQ